MLVGAGLSRLMAVCLPAVISSIVDLDPSAVIDNEATPSSHLVTMRMDEDYNIIHVVVRVESIVTAMSIAGRKY